MSENTKLSLVDTNVLVHAYSSSDIVKHAHAQKLVAKCWQKKVTFALSVQNLAEFFVVVTKKVKVPFSIEEAEQIIMDITAFSHWKILHYNEKTLQRAIQLHKKAKRHFWDAVLAATMQESGIYHIFTENSDDFKRFAGIVAENPLRA